MYFEIVISGNYKRDDKLNIPSMVWDVLGLKKNGHRIYLLQEVGTGRKPFDL